MSEVTLECVVGCDEVTWNEGERCVHLVTQDEAAVWFYVPFNEDWDGIPTEGQGVTLTLDFDGFGSQ